MIGRSSFILRALFTALALGSLVACTFEGNLDDDQDTESANLRGASEERKDEDEEEDRGLVATPSAADGGSAADATVVGRDGGASGGDASVSTDGGRPLVDGGRGGRNDGGDSGPVGHDGGALSDASGDGGGF